jgi:hypothetical protein
LPARDAEHRALSRKIANGLEKIDYTGSGMAIETLIDSTVRVTIRHSDNEPIASVAATASVSRVDATGAERPLKPAAPGDRFMAFKILATRAESPASPNRSLESLAILRRRAPEDG